MKLQCRIQTPLGEMLALAEQDELCGLWFVGQKHDPAVAADWGHDPGAPLFTALTGQLAAYFAGQLQQFELPLAPEGTPFQLSVWTLLQTIPYGTTTSYGALARQLGVQRGGNPPAPQAVGGAVGRNPLSIIIPCHRVVAADGSLTGYSGGLDRKGALLALESS